MEDKDVKKWLDEFDKVMAIEGWKERVVAYIKMHPPGTRFTRRHTSWSLRMSSTVISGIIQELKKEGWDIRSQGRGQNVAWVIRPPKEPEKKEDPE